MGPFTEAPEVSLAHTGSLAAAIVGDPGCASGVGIDIEQITNHAGPTVAVLLTEAERRLLDAQCTSVGERPNWVTRFWAAKEALAKAMGTGLAGRPHHFSIERIDGHRLLVVTTKNGQGHWVNTIASAEPHAYAAAWTLPKAPDPQLDTQRTPKWGTR
jgi:phosphopantetheine--protein transferase-like protein